MRATRQQGWWVSLLMASAAVAGCSRGSPGPAGLFGWLKLRRRNLALLLEGSGWALNDRLMLTQDLAALITRKPRLPKGARIDRTDVLHSAASGLKGVDDGEEGTVPGRVKLLIALVILFALLWQVRIPLVRFACGQQWPSPQTCSAMLPAEPTGKPPSDTP